jgi:hypothetical protein
MDGVLLCIALALAAGGALALLAYASARKDIRAITRPSAAIGEAHAGPVTLAGRIGGEGLPTSPVSEKPCVYMQLSLTARGTPLSEGEWHYHRGGMMYVPGPSADGRTEIVRHADRVWLEDDTGRVFLDLDAAELSLVVDQTLKSSALASSDPRTDQILRRFGARTSDIDRQGSYTLRESILEPGDEVLVIGKLESTSGARLIVRGTREEPMAITDRDAKEMTRELRSKARWSLAGGVVAIAFALLVAVMGIVEGSGKEKKAPARVEKSSRW